MSLYRKLSRIFVLALMVGALMSVYSYSQPGLLTPVFLKIITYDQTFRTDIPTRVNIVVVYDESDAGSKDQFLATQKYFTDNPDITINKSDVSLIGTAIDDIRETLSSLDHDDYTVLLLTAMDESKVAIVIASKEGFSTHTFSFSPDDINRGIAVSIDPKRTRQSILINLSTALAEGSNYDSRLLRMCEVIGGNG